MYYLDANSYISRLTIKLGTANYSEDGLELNPKIWCVQEAYGYYIEMCKTFGVEPQLNLKDFKDLYPIFCFDVSAQKQKADTETINIQLKVEKVGNIPVRGYALILEDTQHKIITKDRKMIRIE